MKEAVLIIGDSWGSIHTLSIIDLLDEMYRKIEPGPAYSIDTNLQMLGYEVINKSFFGASNARALASAENYLRHRSPDLPKIKLIIFFHTELLRDLSHLPAPVDTKQTIPNLQTFDFYLSACHQLQLKVISRIRKLQPNADWAVIGGHAPIYSIEDWYWVKYTQDNWRAEIAGHEIPACHSLCCPDWVAKHFDYVTRRRELRNTELIENVGKNLFRDNVHPDIKHHHALAQEIINHFDL